MGITVDALLQSAVTIVVTLFGFRSAVTKLQPQLDLLREALKNKIDAKDYSAAMSAVHAEKNALRVEVVELKAEQKHLIEKLANLERGRS